MPASRSIRTRSLAPSLACVLLLAPLAAAIAAPATPPTNRSVNSLYLSNWADGLHGGATPAMSLWMASRLSQNDSGRYGPRIAEMRSAFDWSFNQIVDWSSFFRDETNGRKYTAIHDFEATAFLDEGGALRTTYDSYGGSPLPVKLAKDYVMVPNKDTTIATITVRNEGAAPIDWNLLEQIHLANKDGGNQRVFYDDSRRTIFVDMTGSGQKWLAMSAFEAATPSVGDDGSSDPAKPFVSPFHAFDAGGTVADQLIYKGNNVAVAFHDRFTIPANSAVSQSFVVTIRGNRADAEGAVDEARARAPSAWFEDTRAAYGAWLTGPGKRDVHFADEGLNTMYRRGLVTIKNAIRPDSGAVPAATNPFAYGYKIWVRDAAATMIALDQAGFVDEAEKFWYWLQEHQRENGTWRTNYDLWTDEPVPFVEPENDVMGLWLLGAYQHYRQLNALGQRPRAAKFLSNVWRKYSRTARYIANRIRGAGGSAPFGPSDFSIWEDHPQGFYTFTQATYVAGLDAAQSMARAKALARLADEWNGAASTIRSSIQRTKDDAAGGGLWDEAGAHWDQLIETEGYPYSPGRAVTKVDSSTAAMVALGIADPRSLRARRAMDAIAAVNHTEGFGLSRFDPDTFYGVNGYSPAGNESGGGQAGDHPPSWPQLTLYAALYDVYRGDDEAALARLQWVVSRACAGYMGQGEAVRAVPPLLPITSTAVEPVTVGWYVLAALAHQYHTSPRVTPPQYNAGAARTLDLDKTSVADAAPKWRQIPYYRDALGDERNAAADPKGEQDISAVWIANSIDRKFLYLRIRNRAAALPAPSAAVRFEYAVFAEDFRHSTSARFGGSGHGAPLFRPMNFAARGGSETGKLELWRAAADSTQWLYDRDLASDGGLAAWDPKTGVIELQIPLAAFSSNGAIEPGDWANLDVVLARRIDGALADEDDLAIHYRVTAEGEPWLYGDADTDACSGTEIRCGQ